MAKGKSSRRKRRISKRERARRLLRVQSGTLTLYAAYLVVAIRLAVILFHGNFPNLS